MGWQGPAGEQVQPWWTLDVVLIFTFLLKAQILSHSILTTDLEPPCNTVEWTEKKNVNQIDKKNFKKIWSVKTADVEEKTNYNLYIKKEKV